MRFAYADPPYIGQAKKHYGKEATYGGEVDHQALVNRLMAEFPDGWALSASSPSLKEILSYCPDKVRVMAWIKPWSSFKPGVNPAYAWEPVIVWGGRKRGRNKATVRDWISVSITLKKGLCGAKPPAFASWIFQVLGAEAGDELIDIFPGTGIIGRCWEKFQNGRQLELPNHGGTL